MSFSAASNLCNQIGGISIMAKSSPAAAFYRGKLYVFYVGSGNDGLWYTTMTKGGAWSGISHLNNAVHGISIAGVSSPNAVVFNDKLYVFFNGSGNDGTWYTAYDGNSWCGLSSVSAVMGGMAFLPETSPSAAVYQNRIYLFWSGAGNDGMWYCTFDGNRWSGQAQVGIYHGIAQRTSPCAVSFDQRLYLFWNGAGNDGAWFSTWNGGQWTDQTSLPSCMGVMGFLPGTSPGAVVVKQDLLRVLWVGSGGTGQGFWYCDFDMQKWSGQRNAGSELGGQDLGDCACPAAAFFDKLWTSQETNSNRGEQGGDGERVREGMGRAFHVFWTSRGGQLFTCQMK